MLISRLGFVLGAGLLAFGDCCRRACSGRRFFR